MHPDRHKTEIQFFDAYKNQSDNCICKIERICNFNILKCHSMLTIALIVVHSNKFAFLEVFTVLLHLNYIGL